MDKGGSFAFIQVHYYLTEVTKRHPSGGNKQCPCVMSYLIEKELINVLSLSTGPVNDLVSQSSSQPIFIVKLVLNYLLINTGVLSVKCLP